MIIFHSLFKLELVYGQKLRTFKFFPFLFIPAYFEAVSQNSSFKL